MKNFKNFIDNIRERKQLNNFSQIDYPMSIENLQNSITDTLIKLPFFSEKKDKAKEFAQKLKSMVTGDEFLDKISNEIGYPLENESEDDFVKRGLDIIRGNIDKSLNK